MSEGLHKKYEIKRTDGSDQPGKRHDGCQYFVLDLTHDTAARLAATVYAAVVQNWNPSLSRDLKALVKTLEM
jgi:hypothetical protein